MSIRSTVNKIIRRFEKEYETLNLIEISEENLIHNYELFQKLFPNQEIWPVIKSNAYGHGIDQISQIYLKIKPNYLIVDGYDEALRIWQTFNSPTLSIGHTYPHNLKNMKLKNYTLTVYDMDIINELAKLDERVKIHLKINTGMNRQGIRHDEIPKFIKAIQSSPNLELEGILSHLADADSCDNSYTEKQNKEFKKSVALVHKLCPTIKYTHIGASAGAPKTQNLPTNALRIGRGLFGINPYSSVDNPLHKKFNKLHPVMRLTSTIVHTLEVKKGEKVGYSCTFTAPRKTRIGLLPLGYYEGIDRRLSSKGFIKWKSKFLPIVGRVCMNLTLIDLTDSNAQKFDQVEVFSPVAEDKNSIENIAKTCDTSAYDILVKISDRTRRRVVKKF